MRTACLVLAAATAAFGEDASWTQCFDAIPWHHAAEVPDTEGQLKQLVGSGQLAAHSRRWIRAAIAAAPTPAEWCATARKQNKLVFWYVPAVEGQHVILPHLLDRYMTVGPLSHPDVTALLRHRFVCIKLPGGKPLAGKYGLEAPGFIEPGFLILDGDGKVLQSMNRIYTFDAGYLLSVLTTVARKHAPAFEPSGPEEAIEAGEYEAATALLKADARSNYLRAIVARRGRHGRAALKALDAAARDPKLANDIAAERGLVLLRLGHFGNAEQTLQAVAPRTTRAAEAGYWLGVVRFFQKREMKAVATWEAIAHEYPESVWAARAHACGVLGSDGQRGESPLTRGMQDVRWMSPEVYGLGPDTQWRRTPKDADDIARRGLDFLLQQQTSGGHWEGLRWGGGALQDNYNFRVAITALCASALWEWRKLEPQRTKAALIRAELYLLRPDLVRRAETIVWVYADAYRLMHFAKRLPHLTPADRKTVRARMQEWIGHLLKQQEELKGAFKHYTYVSTFVTATAAYCLHYAREAGLDVPKRALERSADVLIAARGPAGRFGYLTANPAVARTPKGASGRQPLCVWVLELAGRAQPKDLHAAVGTFLDQYAASIDLARKSNFHIPALDNTAGYYFFHNFYPACEAARAAGRFAKGDKRKLLELLCELPELDGTFVDAGFSYGKPYATAMALLSLKLLVE